MSEIQRWEVDNIISSKTHYKFEKGRYVLYEDHVAVVKAAVLAERERCHEIVASLHVEGMMVECYTEEVCEKISNAQVSVISGAQPTPAVTCGCPGGYAKVAEVPTSARPERKFKIGNQVTHRDSEKVRKIKNYYFCSENNEWKYDIGFYYVESELTFYIPPTPAELIPTLVEHEWVRGTTVTGESFEGYVIFNNGNTFGGVRILGFDYSTSPGYIKTLERCDPPEVK